MIEITESNLPDCPNVRHKRAGDETYDICGLAHELWRHDKGCLLEAGLECEYYNEFVSKVKEV